MKYIRNHWKGELPLSISFWVNVILINVALFAFETYMEKKLVVNDQVITAQLGLLYALFTIFIIYIWQIVGLWRSAANHVTRTGRFGIARLVQGLIILGFLGTFSNVINRMPNYKGLYQLGFNKDEYANYTITLSNDKTKAHIQGRLSFGVSRDLKDFLDNNGNIEGVILDSLGGIVSEGRELSHVISSRFLNTYSMTGCLSACVTAFIGGKKRILAQGANIGFHQYSPAFESTKEFADIVRELEDRDKQIFLSNGVLPEFVETMFRASNEDMWYPTKEQILASNVVHGFLPPSAINPLKPRSAQ